MSSLFDRWETEVSEFSSLARDHMANSWGNLGLMSDVLHRASESPPAYGGGCEALRLELGRGSWTSAVQFSDCPPVAGC